MPKVNSCILNLSRTVSSKIVMNYNRNGGTIPSGGICEYRRV
jgi:hypothetical protein